MNNNKTRKCIWIVTSTICVSFCIMAGTTPFSIGSDKSAEDAIVRVVSTGLGKTVKSATENACDQAVQQVVGQLIDSETLVENDKLVTDKILSYSGGFVRHYKLIGSPKKTTDGLVSVKIVADVVKDKLTKKIFATDNELIKVSGESLAMAVRQKDNQTRAAEEMLAKEFEGMPCKVLGARIVKDDGQQLPFTRDFKTKEILFKFEVYVKPNEYKSWALGLKKKLDKIISDRTTFNFSGWVDVYQLLYENDAHLGMTIHELMKKNKSEHALVLCMPQRPSQYSFRAEANFRHRGHFGVDGLLVSVYYLDVTHAEIFKKIANRQSMHVGVTVSMLAEDGSSVAEATTPLIISTHTNCTQTPFIFFNYEGYQGENVFYIFPGGFEENPFFGMFDKYPIPFYRSSNPKENVNIVNVGSLTSDELKGVSSISVKVVSLDAK